MADTLWATGLWADGFWADGFWTNAEAPEAEDTSVIDKAARLRQLRRTPRVNIERHVNYMLKVSEPTAEKVSFYREQVSGLTVVDTMGAGSFRGMFSTGDRCFAVVGQDFIEILSDLSYIIRGTLSTSRGPVDMAQGVFSLVIVDGGFGYALRFSDNSYGLITDPDFYGSSRVAFLDGRFIFTKPDSQVFYWSEGIDNATSYDALDFASAESAPDDLVAVLVDHREILLAGDRTIESWYATGSDPIYARNNGTVIEMGLAAAHTLQQIDNSYIWIGRDKNGHGMVWLAGGSNGAQPQRISDGALEEELAKVDDLSTSWAFVFQDAGQTIYALQCPGLDTTWCWNAATRKWHEMADIDEYGEFIRWRGVAHAFAFGRHLIGGDDGVLYQLDAYEHTFGGDPIVREWIAPHMAGPKRKRVRFNSLRLDVTVGVTDSGLRPTIRMCYSNDGGYTWSDWATRSIGEIGQFGKEVKWSRLGMGRDRVWRFRTTDRAKASILGMAVDAVEAAT